MRFYSTNNPSVTVSFQEAVFNSLPQDKGLYMPESLPRLDADFIAHIEDHTLPEIAFHIAHALLKDDLPEDDLKRLIDDAINFPAPVVPLDAQTSVLELFHGPSLAFKDFGARFMSRVMGYFLKEEGQLLDVLVATSGDTGGAVALGFLGVPNTRVTILYPEGKVSAVQELQLTTNGHNIRALEVDGSFDDCQALVKQAFTDSELSKTFRLTSANSINIARLIPQMFYYFNAYATMKRHGGKDIVFSIPSGNFGNIGAGLMAWKMGLPAKQFLAATNANDVVPSFFKTGRYEPRPAVATLSNAMDVGNPSNWARIAHLFSNDLEQLKAIITPYSFDDNQTQEAINQLYKQYGYLACPHTAIAWLALKTWQQEHPGDMVSGIFLSTAHPCKFPDVFTGGMKGALNTPSQVQLLEGKEKQAVPMSPSFEAFKNYLLANA